MPQKGRKKKPSAPGLGGHTVDAGEHGHGSHLGKREADGARPLRAVGLGLGRRRGVDGRDRQRLDEIVVAGHALARRHILQARVAGTVEDREVVEDERGGWAHEVELRHRDEDDDGRRGRVGEDGRLERILSARLDLHARGEDDEVRRARDEQVEVVGSGAKPVVPLQDDGQRARGRHDEGVADVGAAGKVVVDRGVVAVRKVLARHRAVPGPVVLLGAVARRAHVDPPARREAPHGFGDEAVLELRLEEEAEVVHHHPRPGGGQRVDAIRHVHARGGPVEGERRPRRQVVDDLEHGRPLVAAARREDLDARGKIIAHDGVGEVIDAVGDDADLDAGPADAEGGARRGGPEDGVARRVHGPGALAHAVRRGLHLLDRVQGCDVVDGVAGNPPLDEASRGHRGLDAKAERLELGDVLGAPLGQDDVDVDLPGVVDADELGRERLEPRGRRFRRPPHLDGGRHGGDRRVDLVGA